MQSSAHRRFLIGCLIGLSLHVSVNLVQVQLHISQWTPAIAINRDRQYSNYLSPPLSMAMTIKLD